MTHVADDLLRVARHCANAPFFIDVGGEPYTYGDILGLARMFAGSLCASEVGPGDRVLLLLPNGVDYLAAYYGTLLVGATAVGLHTETPPQAFVNVVSNCSPKLCVFDPDRQYLCSPKTVVDRAYPVRDLLKAGAYDGPPVGDGNTVAQIIYTSGTTGKPKGVMLSHAALHANTSGIVEYLGLQSGDRIGVLLDFVYSYGNSLLHTHCRVGGSLALVGDLTFPAQVLARLHDRKCTGLSGVPSTFALLLDRGHVPGRSFPSLRYLTCAGGGLPVANLRRLQQAFAGVEIFLMYGQTEACARLSYLPAQELERRPNSIGKGMSGVTLEVLDSAGRRVAVGQEGEIVASGKNLMSGYWGDSEATSEVLRQGKLWTGDLAVTDEEGFIYITGRKSDLVKVGAYRVHPAEIEEAILSLPGVYECVVLGIPDKTWGETLIACFPPGAAPSIVQVRKHLRDQLPEFKWPRQVVEVEKIPRTPSGKARRRELAEILISQNTVAN